MHHDLTSASPHGPGGRLYVVLLGLVVMAAAWIGSASGADAKLHYPLFYKAMFVQVAAWLTFTVWALHRALLASSAAALLQRSPFDRPLLALFAWGALSLLWAEVPEHTLVEVLDWGAVGLLMIVAYQSLRGAGDLDRLLAAVYAAGVGVAAVGMLQTLIGLEFFAQAVKPASTFGNKNMAVDFLVPVVPLGVYFLLTGSSLAHGKLTASGGLAVLLAYVIVASSRAAWLSLVVEAVALAILLRGLRTTGRPLRLTRSDWIAAAFGAALLVGLLSLQRGGLADGSEIVATGVLRAAEEAGSASYIRYEIWASTLAIAGQHWLAGIGLGNYEYLFPALDRSLAILQHAHQDYLQLFMELGAVGLALFTWLLFAVAAACRRVFRRAQGDDRVLLSVLVMAMAGTLTNALFSFPYQVIVPLLVAGLYLVAVARLHDAWADSGKPPGPAGAQPVPYLLRTAVVVGMLGALLVGQINLQWFQRLRQFDAFATTPGAAPPQTRGLRHPSHERMLQDLSAGLVATGQYQRALQVLEGELLVLRPQHPYERELQVRALLRLQRWDEAIAVLQAHLQVSPPGVRNLQRARLVQGHLALRQNDAATRVLSQAHAAMPPPGTAQAPRGTYFELGRLAMQLGAFPQAADFFRRSLGEDGEHWKILTHLAIVQYRDLGAQHEGLENMRRSLALNPLQENASAFRALLGQAAARPAP